ncbi:MAG: alpha/beta fold hydrolase [Bryobacter sp.]|nr:alpha/beta fold hydrolase [Bryobacter sp.]
MSNFEPIFRQGDLSTLAANFWPRNLPPGLYPEHFDYYQTEPEVRVLAVRNEPLVAPKGKAVGNVVVLHGLEGSHTSGYMLSMAAAALERGFRVHRLNMRTCGGTEALAPTLYHAGLTSDLRAVVAQLEPPVFLVGYSLGGNVVLKAMGEWGDAALEDAAPVAGAVSISTPLDLMACCLRMQEPRNWLYSQKFIKSLKARYRRRHLAYPQVFPLDGLETVKSVLEFDDRFTSKAFGFGDAATYYATQSSAGFLGRIRQRTLLIHAADDPLIPVRVYEEAGIAANPALRLELTRHGGHVGFLARAGKRFWAEERAVAWMEDVMEEAMEEGERLR